MFARDRHHWKWHPIGRGWRWQSCIALLLRVWLEKSDKKHPAWALKWLSSCQCHRRQSKGMRAAHGFAKVFCCMTFLPPHRTSSPMCAVPAERAIHTDMLGFWRSTFMQSNFLLQPNFLPLLHCSEHRKQLQIFPSGARRHTMAKLCLEVSCHHQSVTAFLEQHPCHWTFFGAQGQHTPMPKGKGRDRINIAVGGRLIWMRADSMIFVVIIPVPQHLPRLVKPSGTQVSILKSFIVLHQCGVP